MRTAISLSEFADMLGVSKRLIYKLIERDDAPPLIRVGRRVLIRREAAEKWLAERERRENPASWLSAPGKPAREEAGRTARKRHTGVGPKHTSV